MAQSPDHPELQFVQASGYSAGRAYGPPLWIVVHDMEEEETAQKAEAVANYFATGAGGRSVSSHYCADSDSVVQCVRLADTAWTVGNTPGNYRGINWELAGFASQSREQWLDAFGQAMFARIAPIMRADGERFGIPMRTLTDAEVADNKPGITSHWQLGRVFGGTDHTDPGPSFPWDYLLDLLNGGSTSEDDHMLTIVKDSGDVAGLGKDTLLLCDGIWARPIPADKVADLAYMASQGAISLWHGGEVWDGFGPSWGQVIGSGGGGGLVAHSHTAITTIGPAQPTA